MPKFATGKQSDLISLMKYTNKAFLEALQSEIIESYSNTLVRARKAQKGLRINHLQNIIILSQFGEFSVPDMCRVTKKNRVTTLSSVKNLMLNGYVVKIERGKYRLTEEARTIAEVFTASFRPHVERIYKMMEEDIRRRL